MYLNILLLSYGLNLKKITYTLYYNVLLKTFTFYVIQSLYYFFKYRMIFIHKF